MTRPPGFRGRPARAPSSRSHASIVRSNVFTLFNAILAAFGALTLAFGDWRDALFPGVILANSASEPDTAEMTVAVVDDCTGAAWERRCWPSSSTARKVAIRRFQVTVPAPNDLGGRFVDRRDWHQIDAQARDIAAEIRLGRTDAPLASAERGRAYIEVLPGEAHSGAWAAVTDPDAPPPGARSRPRRSGRARVAVGARRGRACAHASKASRRRRPTRMVPG